VKLSNQQDNLPLQRCDGKDVSPKIEHGENKATGMRRGRTSSDGKALERLVHQIQSALGQSYKVELDEKLSEDGAVRAQFDVTIRGDGYSCLIECRDREENQSDAWVQQLAGRRGEFDFTDVVAVLQRGKFNENAHKSAEKLNVLLREMADVPLEDIKDEFFFVPGAPVRIIECRLAEITFQFSVGFADAKLFTLKEAMSCVVRQKTGDVTIPRLAMLMKSQLSNESKDGVTRTVVRWTSPVGPSELVFGEASAKVTSIDFAFQIEQRTQRLEADRYVVYRESSAEGSGDLRSSVAMSSVVTLGGMKLRLQAVSDPSTGIASLQGIVVDDGSDAS